MRRVLCVMVLAVMASASVSRGDNSLRIVDDQLRYGHRLCDVWCVDVVDWHRLGDTPASIYGTVQPMAAQGVNTIGWTLHGLGAEGVFFNPNGTVIDETLGKCFAGATLRVRDHYVSTIISLFAADRTCRLADKDAYCRAAGEAAKLLGRKHATIFVAGDLFGEGDWRGAPYPLSNPAHAIAVCQAINDANDEPLVAIPAKVVPFEFEGVGDHALCYVADNTASLRALLAEPGDEKVRPLPPGVVVLDARQCLRMHDVKGDRRKAVKQFCNRVEARRMALLPPLSDKPKEPRDDILTPEEKAAGFVPLFNGYTLHGWTTLLPSWSTWSAGDGEIRCNGKDGQWLRTTKRYGSFVLRLEYKIAKNGNSGLFVWSPLDGRSSRFGMEMQIRGLTKKKLDEDCTGAIYEVFSPKVDSFRPAGKWNEVEVVCRGSRVTITVNGQVVQDFDADRVDKLKPRLRRGVIGLQDHGNPVSFRRIRIKELDDKK